MDIVPFEGTMIDGIRKWKKKGTGECRIERGGKVESQREEREPILAPFVSILPHSGGLPLEKEARVLTSIRAHVK